MFAESDLTLGLISKTGAVLEVPVMVQLVSRCKGLACWPPLQPGSGPSANPLDQFQKFPGWRDEARGQK